MTIFGTPVVPDVMSTHSVRTREGKLSVIGAIDGAHRTRTERSSAAFADVPSSITAASMLAAVITAPTCSASASGGRITRRRAIPSSSINASAVVSWLSVARRIDRPARSTSLPPKLVW